MDETKEILRAIRGRLEEVNGTLDGLTHAVARLEGRVEKVELELAAFRQDVTGRFDRVDEKLGYVGEKWLEHDQAIFQLKRKQA